jgi:cycloeucalenol cycloisomerase
MMEARTAQEMGTIFACMFGALYFLSRGLEPAKDGAGRWLADAKKSPAKRATEIWFLSYGVFWIACFGVIVGAGLYASFDHVGYLVVCGGLAAPLYLQPLLFPSVTADQDVSLLSRHAFKTNLWLAIFGFVGNYWYTHYFYSVLKAHYTMPSWDLNGVPIPMYLATHFYFTFYHALSNCLLRKVLTSYAPSRTRDCFFISVVLALSYTTAFMESVTIAAFPCYR